MNNTKLQKQPSTSTELASSVKLKQLCRSTDIINRTEQIDYLSADMRKRAVIKDPVGLKYYQSNGVPIWRFTVYSTVLSSATYKYSPASRHIYIPIVVRSIIITKSR